MRRQRDFLQGLRPCRQAAGFTQSELAQAIGTSRQNIQKWEYGKCWPSAEWLPKLASVCGCRLEDLFEKKSEEGSEEAS